MHRENLKSEYPTDEQIKQTMDAYLKGGDALMELIRKRREQGTGSEGGKHSPEGG